MSVKSNTYSFDARHVLYGRLRAYLNKVLCPDFAGHCSTEIFPLLPAPTLNRRFLFYWLTWRRTCDQIATTATGARMPRANMDEVLEFEIPLPPLDEQKRIVAALDQAFAALDRARANSETGLSDVEELLRTVVSENLENALKGSVERMRLSELCSIARGGSPRPIQKFLTDDADGVNWIKISDATASGMFIEQTQQKISRDGMSRSRYVAPGAFLLTNSMSFGRPYILKTDGCIHDGWLVLEPDYGLVDQEYLYFLLGSKQVYREFDRLAAGSTVRNLNIDLVSKVSVSLPAIERQREAVVSIKNATRVVDELTRHYRDQIADSEALRQSLLQAAFSGQLS